MLMLLTGGCGVIRCGATPNLRVRRAATEGRPRGMEGLGNSGMPRVRHWTWDKQAEMA